MYLHSEDSATHKTNFNIIIMQNVWITLSQHAILWLYISSNLFFIPRSNEIGVQCIVTADKKSSLGERKHFVFYSRQCIALKITPIQFILMPNWCMHVQYAMCNSLLLFSRLVSCLKWEIVSRYTFGKRKKKKK